MQEQPAGSAVAEQPNVHGGRTNGAHEPTAPVNTGSTALAETASTAPAEIAPAEIAPAEIAPAEIAPADDPGGNEMLDRLRSDQRRGQRPACEPVGQVVGRRAPGLTLSETLEVEAVEAPALIDALRAEVCPGALLRALPEGWALDWPEASGSPRLWKFTGAQARRGRGPHMPTDEAAAAGMRLLDATALSLGLGRGHVLPVFENPIRRVIEMEAFCDLPSLDSGSVMEQAAAFLNLGVPVAGVLGLRYEGGAQWSGMRPAQRWDKILLSPRGEGLRERLPDEFATAGEEGFGLLIACPVLGGVSLDLPSGLDLNTLSALLHAVDMAASGHGIGLLVEGEISCKGLACLRIEEAAAGLRLRLPALSAAGASGRLIDGVLRCVDSLGGHVRSEGRSAALGTGSVGQSGLALALVNANRRHPVLTRLGNAADVGPWSSSCRPDEQRGAVAETLDAMALPDRSPPPLGALAALLEGSQFRMREGQMTIAGGPGPGAASGAASAWQGLLTAAALIGPKGGAPHHPLSAYSLPSVLTEDLEALLNELAGLGIALDEAALHGALLAGLPELADIRADAGAVTVRRALVERSLPGDWRAVALEVAFDAADRANGPVPGLAVCALRRLEASDRMPAPHGQGPEAALSNGSVAGGQITDSTGQAWRSIGWHALPMAAFGARWLGRVMVPLAGTTTGPCAGVFAPDALGLALPGGASVALVPDADWRSVQTVALTAMGNPAPHAMTEPAAPASLSDPPLVLGL
ncbi:MAG: hypothetical protein AAFR46_18485 [Pseudomonadota bacterium]